MSELRPWPLIGYAPGGYFCKCSTCGEQFQGDKRAIMCLPCAASRANELLNTRPPPSETPAGSDIAPDANAEWAREREQMAAEIANLQRDLDKAHDALAAKEAECERLRGALKPFATAAQYGIRYLDSRAERQLPENFAAAVERSAEQTGWKPWEDAYAALKEPTDAKPE